MEFKIEHKDDQVIVSEDGSIMLRIYMVERIRGGKIVKELSVGLSACLLVGGFDDSEAQARAYVAAFDLARKVLSPEYW